MGRARHRSRHEPLQLAFAVAATWLLGIVAACAPSPTATPLPSGLQPIVVPDAPERDELDLIRRYKGVDPQPLPDDVLYRDESTGAKNRFSMLDVSGPEIIEVDATLAHVGEHALWYVADDMAVTKADLLAAAAKFDDVIFPTVQETFAPTVSLPGRITILNADPPGLAGYFAASDTLPREAYRFSAERVMVVMNGAFIGDSYNDGTLAHELQHLLSWHVDPSEDTWVSEGLAELSAAVLDLPAFGFDDYLRDTESVSFANWPEDFDVVGRAYAGASLFSRYVADRFGEDNIDVLVGQKDDGVEGVQAFLDAIESDLSFNDLLGDWLVANVVGASEGPYAYTERPGVARIPHLLNAGESVSASAPQIGGTYVRVQSSGEPVSVTFDGEDGTPAIPVAPHSDNSCWWSNRGDNIDSTLTRDIDLSDVSEASLSFWGWHQIEEGFDYGYVAVSQDDGQTWQALEGSHTTGDDPVGASLGHGYTGHSEDWQREEIDLSPYAGSEILLRFNYVTDESINNAGWCVDDLSIQELGYADDAESERDWEADGFVRITPAGVAQTFVVRAITGTGNEATVRSIQLDANNDVTFVIRQPTVIVVGGLSPKATQPGRFTVTTSNP